MIKKLNELFKIEELTGKDFQEMIFLLNACNNLIELSNTWQLFNDKKLFNGLTNKQTDLIIERKNFLKRKLTNNQI